MVPFWFLDESSPIGIFSCRSDPLELSLLCLVKRSGADGELEKHPRTL